jgi:mono/diheme cytochrome c family protein
VKRPRTVHVVATLAIVTAGCRQRFDDDAKYEPLRPSTLFSDGASARPLIAGTVPRETPFVRTQLIESRLDGDWVDAFPISITREVLETGRERYEIYCSPCHGLLGEGDGIVAQRGFPGVQSLHTERVRNKPLGYYFDVVTNGRGAMYPYGSRIEPLQRWAIIAYIQVLQRSQHLPAESLQLQDRQKLTEVAP